MKSEVKAGMIDIDLADEEATVTLGRELALILRPDDCVCLWGDLGAGKTTLARGIVGMLSREREPLDVPSPSFALTQVYETTRHPIAHYDFYRLAEASEAVETGFPDLNRGRITLVEWPERVADDLPEERLDIRLNFKGEGRRATLIGRGGWGARIERWDAARTFIACSGWGEARRRFLDVDASVRRYERLRLDGREAILMDMPAMPDGPPVKDGKPYSAIAHLAENCRAVVAVNEGLRRAGFSAPEIFSADMARGFLLIEDLGDRVFGRMAAERQDMGEPLLAAVTALAEMAGRDWPSEAPLPDGSVYRFHAYDSGALEIELSLLPDWFWPIVKGGAVPAEAKREYEAAWREALPHAAPKRPVWVLRDYHSPNLLWLPEREGVRRVGMIDTQDALLGHSAYDLASLLQDARVDVPPHVAQDLLDYYCALRETSGESFDREAFFSAFSVLGAQRASKILGIFARLWKRDGKPRYLKHLPRVSRLLERNLAHPALEPVRDWFARHLPATLREREVGIKA